MLEEGEEEREEEEEEVAPLLKSRDLSPGRWETKLKNSCSFVESFFGRA